MAKRILFCTLLFLLIQNIGTLCDAPDAHIIYVHLGDAIPPYAYIAFEQARLFNEHAAIVLIANTKALEQSSYDFAHYRITTIACETLQESEWHTHFKSHSALDPTTLDGFWRKTTERFFYLHEYIALHHIKGAVHMEYDTMLYADIAQMKYVFSHYKGIAAVFDCDTRCIPCFLYIADATALTHLVQFIAAHAHQQYNDMQLLALYHNNTTPDYIDLLPLIMPEYVIDHTLMNKRRQTTKTPHLYWRHIELFDSIFDGAALGQYLGGIDPRNGFSKPGFINETCLFNPSHITIEWHLDEKNRKIPFAICHNKAYRINNLHIHSKKLEKFRS